MTSTIQGNFEILLEESPNFLTASDLVKMGLFPSTVAVYKSKERGDSPPYLQLSERKLRFPKNGLIGWLSARQPPAELSA